jgi:hypothetical protein
MKLLSVIIASKETLKKELFSLLEIPDFGEDEPSLFKLVENLTIKLKDDISFVIEYPYVDRHYRNTYYSFFSSKLKDIDRECIRVHIFDKEINKDDIFNQGANLSGNYLGFFIIRPLKLHMLGRSLISPKAFKEKEFVCCLMKDQVSLFGNEFTVCGFPHIAQDEETHTCSESALWCLYEYYGSKYSQYKPLLPSQIVESLQINAEQRILPTKGLSRRELARCLNSNGFQSLLYSISSRFREQNIFFLSLNIYIESGIPLLLMLKRKGIGHVVLVIGHEENDTIYFRQNNKSPWLDVSLNQKKIIFIDDNLPPYYISSLEHYKKDDGEIGLTYRNWDVSSFIVPLPSHMFLVAEAAYDLVRTVLNNPTTGLEKRGGKWTTRLLLTSGHSFKKFIFNHNGKMEFAYKKHLLRLPLPKFIWLCEIYEANNFVKDGYCDGILIIDATSDGKSHASVLFFMLGKDIFTHNDFKWNNPITDNRLVTFKFPTYRNNLKGEWCQWKTN